MIDRHLSGYGGIGRRAGFRFQWATVQVQVLLSALDFKTVHTYVWMVFLFNWKFL